MSSIVIVRKYDILEEIRKKYVMLWAKCIPYLRRARQVDG